MATALPKQRNNIQFRSVPHQPLWHLLGITLQRQAIMLAYKYEALVLHPSLLGVRLLQIGWQQHLILDMLPLAYKTRPGGKTYIYQTFTQ